MEETFVFVVYAPIAGGFELLGAYTTLAAAETAVFERIRKNVRNTSGTDPVVKYIAVSQQDFKILRVQQFEDDDLAEWKVFSE